MLPATTAGAAVAFVETTVEGGTDAGVVPFVDDGAAVEL